MIKYDKLSFFDKNGYDLNLFPTSSLQLRIYSNSGMGAIVYPYLNTLNEICGFVVHRHGYGYGTYTNNGGDITQTVDVQGCEIIANDTVIGEVPLRNITYGEVSMTDSHGTHDSLCIKGVSVENIVVDYELMGKLGVSFPSVTYTGAMYTNPISTGLIETEQVNILYTENDIVTNVYDTEDSSFVVNIGVGDTEIKMIDVDEDANSIVWTDSIECDTPKDVIDSSPLSFNIAFKSEDEGVFENTIDIYYSVNNKYYQIAEIIINCEAVGEDDRYRGLLANFGLPDPKTYINILKESDINEALPDYNIINNKSKELFLEHDNIFKFCGSYKALINAVKYLGYDDIFFREWFLDTATSTRKSFKVSYGSESETIKSIPYESRKTLKKLNSLSMVYHINQETGEYDESGVPVVRYNFEHNVKESRIKLVALREWLTKHIIGVNCKITDITAEGVYYELFDNSINGMINKSLEVTESLNLTPIIDTEYDVANKEFTNIIGFDGDKAELNLSVLETSKEMSTIQDMQHLTIEDLSYDKVTPSSIIHNVSDFLWKAKIKVDSTILHSSMASNNLWVYDNTLRIRDVFSGNYDKTIKSVFNSTDSNINLVIAKGYIRNYDDASTHSTIKQSITVSENVAIEKIKLNPESGEVTFISDTIDKEEKMYCIFDNAGNIVSESSEYFYISLKNGAVLSYEYVDSIKAYGLVISNFKTHTGVHYPDKYLLEISDGHIDMDTINTIQDNTYLNTKLMFYYDTKYNQQQIYAYHTYYTPRLSATTETGVSVDYKMSVNHIGKYKLELQAWNPYNILFVNESIYDYEVVGSMPNINTYIVTEDSLDADLIDNSISDKLDSQPIFDEPVEYAVSDINEFKSVKGHEYSVNTISNSYLHRAPYMGSYVTVFDKNIYNKSTNLIVDEIYDENVEINGITTQRTKLIFKQPFTHEFIVGDVISININIHKKGNSAYSMFRTSATVRIRNIGDDKSILVDSGIIPSHILQMFKPIVDMCSISVTKPWSGVDNISSFRVEDSTEYDISGNKLVLNFKQDGYILPYIDRNFILRIDDFDISEIKFKWLSEIASNLNIYKHSTYLTNYTDIILMDADYNDKFTYVWSAYNNGELFYRLYNDVIGLRYDLKNRYDIVVEKVDKYGNIYKNNFEGLVITK